MVTITITKKIMMPFKQIMTIMHLRIVVYRGGDGDSLYDQHIRNSNRNIQYPMFLSVFYFCSLNKFFATEWRLVDAIWVI